MKDIDYRTIQSYISSFKGAPKTCRNHVLVLQMMWHAAKAGGWVNHKPFEDLKYPKPSPVPPAFFTAEEAGKIIAAAEGQWKTLYWVAAETGMLHPTTIRRDKLAPLCRKLGINVKNMKAFRHGCATMMDQANFPAKVRQERLGHAVGSKVTMVHYTHSLPADHRAAAVAVGGLLAS